MAYEHDSREDEWVRVERWRLKVLLEAGYSLLEAERIAVRGDVDLHRAVELVVEQGCRPEVAVAILL